MDVLRERDKTQHEDCGTITKKVISLCNNSQNIPSKIENVAPNRLDCVPNSSICEEGTLLDPETQLLPPLDGPFELLTEEELAFFDKPDPGYPQAYVNKKSE
ncbi:hypothetical protein MTR67_017927 [Solanum verrucosum]|uniref:Uncharacterized protein n=1 Tax=Solanum verrucosum TaxID=315347 RepID=A0AAF0QKS3_SOLVR|nr:hypothetical protein MTR67_017927 [Solanum verrucosum]